MPFDKKAYQREYMRRRRADNPSYGQSKSESSLETENGNGYEEDFTFPELPFSGIVLIIIVILVIGVFSTWAYFKFFRKKKSEEEEVL